MVLSKQHLEGEPSMAKATGNLAGVTRVGLDLAKTVFQIHGVDAQGEVVVVRKLRRGGVLELFGRLAPWVVAVEECESAHHWGGEITALGHEVNLIPPAHLKPGACPRARPQGPVKFPDKRKYG
jgi:hypothetical protein